MEKITNSEAETLCFAREFAAGLRPGDTVCLSGDLGVGKTIFTKGICEYFRVEDIVNSPTFTIVNEYSCSNGDVIYHFDMYRIDDEDELIEIGFDDYLNSGSLCLIEWPEKTPAYIPKQCCRVTISRHPEAGDDARIITVERF